LNDRGQTPSEVSQMFNANREALGLLEDAAIMRREVSTGTGGLIGTTFVHDDGQVGTVVDAVERWAFTLEVELDGWKMVNGSGAKLYLPVSGERLNTRSPPSSAGAADTTSDDGTTSGSRSNPTSLAEPILWLADTVQRMRLESEDLVRVTADSLVGARVSRRTPLGGGRVTAVRNVKIRCDLRTAASSARAGSTTVPATGSKRERCANATFSETRSEEPELSDLGESLGMPMQEAQSCRSCSTASSDHDVGLKVLEVGLAAGLGAVGHHGDRERHQGEDGSKATISCATPRGPENADHGHRQVGPSRECSTRRCLSARLVQVASKRGVSRRHREQRASSEDSWAKDGDTDDESGAPDDWSVGTESAAEFDACVATTVNEGTREGFGSQRAGTESRSTNRRGAPSQDIGLRTRRFSFLDNLVPLAALEGVLDCNHLPPSAVAPQSRARRRQLLSHWNTRTSVSMAAGGGASAAPTSFQRRRAHQHDILQHSSGGYSVSPSPASTHSMLEVDDLSERGVRDGEGDDDLLGIVGLEEKIEREERSAERMDGKRIGVEATRKAVREALVLWSGKADILQGRLVVLRTVSASVASTVASSHTQNATSAMSLEEFLASPSPRCCACDMRDGYYRRDDYDRQTPIPPASDNVLRGSGIFTASNNGKIDTAQKHTSGPVAHACYSCAAKSTNVGSEPHDDLHVDGASSDDYRNTCAGVDDFGDTVKGTSTSREEGLVVDLEECLVHMTHLRDWLRLLDQEIGQL
ncbi:unnamed protein product, partial [Ectocarpus sp. 8 AP-2014]